MTSGTVLEFGNFRVFTVVTNRLWKENCYLVRHSQSGEQVIVDPGDDAERIIEVILEGGNAPNHILLTHAHHDHVGAVAALCRRFDLSCELHADDVRLLRQAPIYALSFAHRKIETPGPFRVFDNEQMLRVGSQSIEVIHTPGHTPGSVCFCFGSFIFTGDTLLYEHVGRTDLPGSDVSLQSASIQHLLELVPDDAVLLPGHGRTWTGAEAKVWWQRVASAPPPFNRFED